MMVYDALKIAGVRIFTRLIMVILRDLQLGAHATLTAVIERSE
jgi:hypothetical protein